MGMYLIQEKVGSFTTTMFLIRDMEFTLGS